MAVASLLLGTKVKIIVTLTVAVLYKGGQGDRQAYNCYYNHPQNNNWNDIITMNIN